MYSMGITNKTEDGYFLPFFDYDETNISETILDLIQLQTYFDLSDTYIVESSKGFNAFSLDKLNFETLKMIYEKSNCCKGFINLSIKRGYSTLRIGDDKKYCHVVKSPFKYRIKSQAHYDFFINVCNFPLIYHGAFDMSTLIRVVAFEDNKYGHLDLLSVNMTNLNGEHKNGSNSIR